MYETGQNVRRDVGREKFFIDFIVFIGGTAANVVVTSSSSPLLPFLLFLLDFLFFLPPLEIPFLLGTNHACIRDVLQSYSVQTGSPEIWRLYVIRIFDGKEDI
jgi:hypothetical protein